MRKALSFENVLVTVVAFVVLAGGSAFAANQLGKNSVGAKQLKAKSVTAAKIKKNAVTTAKIKKSAVTGAKVKDGTLQPADLNLAEMPYSHVVFQTTGSANVALSPTLEAPTAFTLDTPTYTQDAGRLDTYQGAIDVTFPAACEAPRIAVVYLLKDSPTAAIAGNRNVAAAGQMIDEGTGAVTERISLSPYGIGASLPPAAATNHSLLIAAVGECKSGGGITATNGLAQVVGTR